MKNIQMNMEMTKALLDGRKTQTRRVAKVRDISPFFVKDNTDKIIKKHSKYKKDETIWVREPARVISHGYKNAELSFDFKYSADSRKGSMPIPERFIDTDFDNNCDGDKDKPTAEWIIKNQGIPNGCIREMARIFLNISNVRVERLHNISIEDILEEGFPIERLTENCGIKECMEKCMQWYKTLWNKTTKQGYKWDDNPFVFVYEFQVSSYKTRL